MLKPEHKWISEEPGQHSVTGLETARHQDHDPVALLDTMLCVRSALIACAVGSSEMRASCD